MSNFSTVISKEFNELLKEIPHIGFKKNANFVLEQVEANQPHIKKSVKDLPALTGEKANSGIVISAGPSLLRTNTIKRILDSNYKGTLIAVDGAYIACLKAGLYPDYVVTLDPYGSRVVRWFGDPNFEENTKDDDYFARQDLDIDFRKNSIEHNEQNIKLVDEHASKSKFLVCTSADQQVVQRLQSANSDMYWWNPLVDDPNKIESLTRKFYEQNKLPCMNTGGTVGTAAWVFASSRLNLPKIALTGMDYGYYSDAPIEKTQTYYELIKKNETAEGLENYFTTIAFPLTGEKFYCDPTYYWYRNNFIELLRNADQNKTQTINCTEAGTLVDDSITCMNLNKFIEEVS